LGVGWLAGVLVAAFAYVVVDEFGEEDVGEILDVLEAGGVGFEIGGFVGEDDASGGVIDLVHVGAGDIAEGMQDVGEVFWARGDDDA